MKFKEFGLLEPIIKALEEEGYETPTPIQEQAIPIILDGKDILGCAQTGTGKTAAFALPIIEQLLKQTNNETRNIQVLIMTPTRELAIQIRDNFRNYGKYTKLKCSVIFGGVNQKSQIEVLRKGVDILVATPGRLLDLINQRHVNLSKVKHLVLDEADTMLDMGFIHDVKKIITNIPNERQTLLFSATMPKEIGELAKNLLKNPSIIKVNPVSSTVDTIDQSIYYIDKNNKSKLLIELLNNDVTSALIFTRTKHGANKLGDLLKEAKIKCGVIHGNKSQSARVQALKQFKDGITKVLIATDIAARGIDINELSHVFNYEMPNQAETYIHRIGRTGRAGLKGVAISLCDIDEKAVVKEIENLIKQQIRIVENNTYPMQNFTLTPKKGQTKGRSNNNSRTKNSKNKYNKDTSKTPNWNPKAKSFHQSNRRKTNYK